MSILHVAPGLTLPSTLWMRRQLEMIGDSVDYLYADAYSVAKYKHKYRCRVMWLSNYTVLNRFYHYVNLFRLYRDIHRKKIKVIFIHYATTIATFEKVLRTTKKPIFVHCHGYDVTWDGRSNGALMHSRHYVEQLLAMPENIIFIGNSKRTIQRLLDIGIPSERTILKYLGVDVPVKYPERHEAKNRLTVLYLGRLIDFKGPDLVIRAFELACSDGFNGDLVIAGDGPLMPVCELLRAHSPFKSKIKLLGVVDAATGKKLRDEADIFTAHNCTGPLSNQEEAFGVTIVEAMAEGLPIINASNGSIPELLEDGVSAILIKSGDVRGHANAFLRLQNEPGFRASIAKNAWERVRANFPLQRESEVLRRILNLSIPHLLLRDRKSATQADNYN